LTDKAENIDGAVGFNHLSLMGINSPPKKGRKLIQDPPDFIAPFSSIASQLQIIEHRNGMPI
jgi:hypothetical protein